MAFQQYNVYDGLTAVRLVSVANIAGTYSNGPSNNGVGATLTIAASSLTIDSVVCVVGDRVLLQTQTNTFEQGIYVVLSIGSTVVLQRSADQQSIEQMKAGQYVSVGAGSLRAGNIYTIVEPLPAALGVNGLVWNADPSSGAVAFSGGASTADALVVFSDTAGNIKAQTTASTLGFGLTISTGNFAVSAGTITASGAISSTAGNITSGSSGDAGNFVSFPATAANGTFIFEALNAGGAFNTTLRNSTMGQSSVISLPDPGTATANVLLNNSAGTQTIATGSLALTVGYYTESAVNALTALAGGAQAGTALTRQINRVTTVTSAADSVQLPAATAGRVVTVINAAAANAMAVFPQTGEIINALAANASISVAANKVINFYCAVAGTWNSLLTA